MEDVEEEEEAEDMDMDRCIVVGMAARAGPVRGVKVKEDMIKLGMQWTLGGVYRLSEVYIS